MIFEDISQRRWKIARLMFLVIVGISIVLIGTWVLSFFVNPPLPSILAREQNRKISEKIKEKIEKTDNFSERKTRSRTHKLSPEYLSSTSSLEEVLFSEKGKHTISAAFLDQSDPVTPTSLQEHASNLDLVLPDWFTITTSSCDVSLHEDVSLTKISIENKLGIFPRLSNGVNGEWNTENVRQTIGSYNSRKCIIDRLVDQIKNRPEVFGINIDFENLEAQDREYYLDFLSELALKLHENRKFLSVDVPVGDPVFDMEYIGSVSDLVILMAYDEHYPSGAPGPIASQNWYQNAIDEVVGQIPSHKLLIALGNYGYDWTLEDAGPAKSYGYNDIISIANDSGAYPELVSSTRNMGFAYQDYKNKNHEVWFLNSITAWNEWLYARGHNVLGSALWRLGTEDPLVWKFLNNSTTSSVDLSFVPALNSISYGTEGELFTIDSSPSGGNLDITYDDDGSIDYAGYKKLPSGYNLSRFGKGIAEKSLVLTFDDGPDPIWTPKILDVLKKYNIPGAFFVVGQQAEQYPELIKEMSKQGLVVGNHTYTHPNISTISHLRLRREINATERIIESAYGRKTIFFRAPYDTDTSPSSLDQVVPLSVATKLGYKIVGANIDSEDWEKPGVNQIIKNIENGLHNPDNHIIVMHDAGGDRSQTVDALDRIIPELQKKGYKFISLPEASGFGYAEVMPGLGSDEWWAITATKIIMAIRRWGWSLIVFLFFFTTFLSIVRLVFLGYLVIRSRKKTISEQTLPWPDSELLSVVIPAFNEEKTIAKTVASLQKSDLKNIEIIIVNDGSIDATASTVEELRKGDKRIKLISKQNGGKSDALNVGIKSSAGNIVAVIDADTIVYPETLSALIRPFAKKDIDAVCGNVEVGNVHNLLTAFQSLEYTVSQNFDRRAFEELNCISVVPGATGAWRKDKLLEIGGYTNDTLTEDADVTIRLLRAGGKIAYAADARSKTEAPETIRALSKQRFRWSYGTFQCFFKHRSALFKGSLGWVAFPNMFLFQLVFPVLSPLGDLIFVLSLFRADMKPILVGYLLFLAMDISGAILAFILEKKANWNLIWLTLIQRFFYRQFMYVVTYRSIIAAIKGYKQGWNKLQRSGKVQSLG